MLRDRPFQVLRAKPSLCFDADSEVASSHMSNGTSAPFKRVRGDCATHWVLKIWAHAKLDVQTLVNGLL